MEPPLEPQEGSFLPFVLLDQHWLCGLEASKSHQCLICLWFETKLKKSNQ